MDFQTLFKNVILIVGLGGGGKRWDVVFLLVLSGKILMKPG